MSRQVLLGLIICLIVATAMIAAFVALMNVIVR